jgi:hypothetical protein
MMKQPLLGAMALLAVAGSCSAARAVPFDFTYTGSLVTFTVPTTDTYQILAFGAQGGSGTFCAAACFVGAGGKGAEIGGSFSLTAGEVLQIAVGGMGSDSLPLEEGGGGGGGGFVVGPGNTPLVIAGGGGGGGASTGGPLPGLGGLTGPDGGSVFDDNGGTGGNGGGFGTAGGGGGFLSDGGTNPVFGAAGGGAFPGLTGGGGFGAFGGFGGGGAGSCCTHSGGGGGGGYSGGGGDGGNNSTAAGGGGGSWDAGFDQILIADFRTGNGEVIITEIAAAIPEPSSFVPFGAGLLGLVAMMWWRRQT